MTAQGLAAASGLSNYDAARWTDWVPELSLVRNDGGMASLYQRVPKGAVDSNIVVVPPNDRHVLLIWTKGTPELAVKIARTPYAERAAPWQATLLPVGTDSEWRSTPQAADGNFHLHFDAALMAACAEAEGLPASAAGLRPIYLLADPGITHLGRWLLGVLEQTPDPSRLLWDAAAHAMAVQLLRAGTSSATWTRPAGRLADWQVRRVKALLRDDLTANVRLDALAAEARLSPYYFARAFKATVGLPPHGYLMRLRLEHAQQLLETSTLSICEIAAAVGYADQGTLTRMFRKVLGVSPSAYRRARR